ncbi:hypothetical protein D3C81_2016150 [compost metagenome]
MRQPGFPLLGQLNQFGHLWDGHSLEHFAGQQQLGTGCAGLGQTIKPGNLVTQAQQRAVQVKQRRLTLGLDQRLGIHGPAFLRLAKGF